MRWLLSGFSCIFIVGCHREHVRPEYGISFKVIEKMPYATAPDLCVELNRKW